jgi:hypothetical protein
LNLNTSWARKEENESLKDPSEVLKEKLFRSRKKNQLAEKTHSSSFIPSLPSSHFEAKIGLKEQQQTKNDCVILQTSKRQKN